ncbi:APC family permease [Streptomyces sp. NBC_00572]|uniref:APC family permease n=1 Tax=Streptomyces sp. NBC_00572 TaxID=2903664 RepID=UPI00225A587E|nr:APC family permease [Streptomyces sp. NBC_00572]MCX4984740.1 APC family permease [Streptomyces sp. NBC_00572]
MNDRSSSGGGGLRAGALGTFDSVVMAVAGCGPAYIVVALIPALVATVGFAAPAALLYGAIPMVGIALAFRYLGRLDVNAGATYSWVARTLHPVLGFLSGWAVVAATVLFIIASTTPAGMATLSLFDEDLARNDVLATGVGLGWFLLIAALVASGTRIAAGARAVAVGTQLALLLAVAVTALTQDTHAAAFSLSWFGFEHFDATHSFTAGALIVGALYWGWDVTANLSEETRSGRGGSGLGGLIGLLVVATTLLTLTVSVNVLLGPGAVTATDASFLLKLGEAAWPGVGGTLLALAVPLAMVATLETTLLQATRTLFAMGRDRTVPSFLGRVHPRRKTPVASTLVVCAVAVTTLTLITLTAPGFGILDDALMGIGLLIAFYYALAGVTVTVAFRSVLFSSPGNLILLGLWPLAGVAFNVWVFVASVRTLSGTQLAIGLGALAVGLIPLGIARLQAGRAFFHLRPLNPQEAAAVEAYATDDLPELRPADGRRDGLLSDF